MVEASEVGTRALKARIDALRGTVAAIWTIAGLPRRTPTARDRTSVCVEARTCRLQRRFDDVERQTTAPRAEGRARRTVERRSRVGNHRCPVDGQMSRQGHQTSRAANRRPRWVSHRSGAHQHHPRAGDRLRRSPSRRCRSASVPSRRHARVPLSRHRLQRRSSRRRRSERPRRTPTSVPIRRHARRSSSLVRYQESMDRYQERKNVCRRSSFVQQGSPSVPSRSNARCRESK